MGPIRPEAEAEARPAAVVDYKAAAARGDRVPRMVAALESKLTTSDQNGGAANGGKHPSKNQSEMQGRVMIGKVDENGHRAKEEPASTNGSSDVISAQVPIPEDGWEPADAPGSHKKDRAAENSGSHKQEKAPNTRSTEHGKKEGEVKAAALSPTAPPASISDTSTVLNSAKERREKESVVQEKDKSAPPETPVAESAATSSSKVQEEEKPTRTFCLVRIPRPDGSIGGAAIREAENRLKDKREKQEFLTVALRLKQISRNEANAKVKEALDRMKACREQVKSRMELVKPLWDTQRRLQEAGKMANSRRRDLPCSTEAELDQKIQQLEYTRQHESQSLNEEKRILREIRQLESSREQVKANSALLSQFTSSGAERESISTQIKPLQAELDVLRAEEAEAKKALDVVDAEQKELNRGVEELLAQREEAREEHQAAYEELKKLRQQAAQRDHDYYNNRRDIQKFKDLASKGDIPALEEFANTQVEPIMARFSTDAAYRATYVKNNEISTLRRFGSLDTRSPGVDEDPAPLSPTPDRAAPKPSLKESKAEPAPAKARSPLTPAKGVNSEGAETAAKAKPKVEAKPKPVETKPKPAAKAAAPLPEVETSGKAAVPAVAPVDKAAVAAAEAEAKEKRREEEVRKAKDAEERKRKQAEKKAAKAEQRRRREEEEAAKKKDKKKQTATPPPEAADSDSAAVAAPEQENAVSSASVPEAAGNSVAEEGTRRRTKAGGEKKKLKKPLGRNKRSSLQSWLQANMTLVIVVALVLCVLLSAYLFVKAAGPTSRD